jgi:hypothetical protein
MGAQKSASRFCSRGDLHDDATFGVSGFCGWLGDCTGLVEPAALLHVMAGALGPSDASPTTVLASPSIGLALSGGTGSASALHSDGVIACIDGYPRWRRDHLQQLANRQGHAAALIEAYCQEGQDLLQALYGGFSLAVIKPGTGHALPRRGPG